MTPEQHSIEAVGVAQLAWQISDGRPGREHYAVAARMIGFAKDAIDGEILRVRESLRATFEELIEESKLAKATLNATGKTSYSTLGTTTNEGTLNKKIRELFADVPPVFQNFCRDPETIIKSGSSKASRSTFWVSSATGSTLSGVIPEKSYSGLLGRNPGLLGRNPGLPCPRSGLTRPKPGVTQIRRNSFI